MIQGIVNFQRIPNYQIFCTYLPTTCILFMAVLTMFIDESHFEATIMVALTAMLVLYTLFQSISEVMPTTSYLKLIGIIPPKISLFWDQSQDMSSSSFLSKNRSLIG